MDVPFFDARAGYLDAEDDLRQAFERVMQSGWYIGGEELQAFESEFATYCQADHCVGVGNGLDALHLAIRAMGIGDGDEVIVPASTFVATWLGVSYAGATPVPVEVDERTYNLAPELIEAAITPRTRAIVAVHLYGQPADMDAIADIGSRNGLRVIEDAAQSHGARWNGRRTGGLADAATFSFYPVKNLGAFGDAGAVTTDDAELAQKVRMLGNYGSVAKYDHQEQGFNSRLDPLQAAFLRARLERLDADNDGRRRVAARYSSALADTPELVLPWVPDAAESVWHQYVVRHPRRDELAEHLEAAGVGTLIHYPIPPHRSGAYVDSPAAQASFPLSERIADTVLSLPMAPGLEDAAVDHVTDAIRAFALA